MPTRGRKRASVRRVDLEHVLAIDVTHLRFTRSHDLADPPEGQRIRQDQRVVRGARERT
jgi:hypothetical protein